MRLQCRPLRRCLLNLLTAVSLLTSIAVCVMWVRSYFAGDSITWNVWRGSAYAASVQVFSGSGQVGLGYHQARSVAAAGSPFFGTGSRLKWQRSDTSGDGFRATHLWAFHYLRSSYGSLIQRYMFQTPYWFPAALAAGLAAFAGRMSLRAGKPGRCRSCGYDLRATPGRCPEWGSGGS